MMYDNDTVRRRDRLLGEPEALALLREGEYGVLSMAAEGGGAYGIPVSYVWDGAGALYFHCAPEGRKLSLLAADDRASFCVVGRTRVIPDQFTTAYESIVLEGRVRMNLPGEERWRALELLLKKYSPDDVATGMKYAERSFHRTNVLRFDIGRMSGKRKRVG